jgi:hypothetical protein
LECRCKKGDPDPDTEVKHTPFSFRNQDPADIRALPRDEMLYFRDEI